MKKLFIIIPLCWLFNFASFAQTGTNKEYYRNSSTFYTVECDCVDNGFWDWLDNGFGDDTFGYVRVLGYDRSHAYSNAWQLCKKQTIFNKVDLELKNCKYSWTTWRTFHNTDGPVDIGFFIY